MTINKETIAKVKRLNKIEEEAEQLRAELHKEFAPYFDGCYIEGYRIDDEPAGDYQQDGEYCDQWTGYTEDTGDGVYYYPIEKSKKYLGISYSF